MLFFGDYQKMIMLSEVIQETYSLISHEISSKICRRLSFVNEAFDSIANASNTGNVYIFEYLSSALPVDFRYWLGQVFVSQSTCHI